MEEPESSESIYQYFLQEIRSSSLPRQLVEGVEGFHRRGDIHISMS